MRRQLFLIGCYFSLVSLFAQPNIDKKRDYNFFTGYGSYAHNTNPIAGTTLTSFKYCTVQQNFKNNPLEFKGTPVVMSDTSGKVLFTFNGYKITDTSYQIMQNGDSLCIPNYVSNNGSYVIDGAIALPKPNNNHIYYIFHHLPYVSSDNYSLLKGLYVTTIDMNLNNGKGGVIERERKMLRDTATGTSFRVCRHANGRDWWFLRVNWRLSKVFRLLISPNGIDSLPPQQLPYPSTTGLTYGSFYSQFSPDGSKYAHKIPLRGIYLYDFDRCNGTLSNRKFIPRITTYGGETYAGICFSPNSRYLYCTTDTSVIQYDTYAADIPNSAITVGLWDGTFTDGTWHLSTKFLQPFNAPNGKIYINGPGGCKIWHTIHNPNGAGTTCDLRLHDVLLPTIYYGTTPNFPNFRLGALRGSPCDTLGIEEGAEYICESSPTPTLPEREGEQEVRVFPNPTNGNFTLQISNDLINSNYMIIDATGKTVLSNIISNTNQNVDIQNISAGVYYIKIIGNTYAPIKLIIIK